jgi:hypothetical protein
MIGRNHYISNAMPVDSYVDLPILIEAVHADDEKPRFHTKLESILENGLVTLERLQTIFYSLERRRRLSLDGTLTTGPPAASSVAATTPMVRIMVVALGDGVSGRRSANSSRAVYRAAHR